MINRQITHTRKESLYNNYNKRITAIAGFSWHETAETAVKQILKGTHSYFLKNNFEEKIITVKYRIEGEKLVKYLNSQIDHKEHESLLKLCDF